MLHWDLLLSDLKRKQKHDGIVEGSATKGNRTEAERDFDRILFSGPTRRLADKTQVFPLDPSDSVRTRLTHSYEVSNLARSLGMRLAFDHAEEIFGSDHEKLQVKRKIPAVLAAIGLAHDLGNPPFGHQGEVAVREWFKKQPKELKIHDDFTHFDGNPQTFRLLTKLQILNDDFGLNLSYGTLAALVKYPVLSSSKDKRGYEKFGVFESEKEIIEEIWKETGLEEGVRHPLTHIVEACDDMAYAVVDAEDTVKKGYASFNDVIDHLESDKDEVIEIVVKQAKEKNEEFKKLDLSSLELNEISMQMFRVFAIYQLVEAVTKSFVSYSEKIMSEDVPENFKLINHSGAYKLCSSLKKFDRRHGFSNRTVLRLELEGHNYVDNTMGMLWDAIREGSSPFARYANTLISENYRRVHESSNMDKNYKDCQLLSDTISGMTDSYLINIHNDLKPLYDGFSRT